MTAARPAAAQATALALAAAALVSVALRGGFFDAGRAALLLGGGVALLLAVLWDEAGVLAALRSPPIALLALLAALSAASALWTIASPHAALADALTIAGVAACATAASCVATSPRGVERLAAAIVAVALAAALAGLVAWALRVTPWALRIDGRWRLAGPFEYPPALALLQLAALPALLAWAGGTDGRAWAARLGAGCAVVAVGLAGGRLAPALALALLVAIVLRPRATIGAPRRRALALAAALLALGAAALLAGQQRAVARQAGARGAHARAHAGAPSGGLLHGRARLWSDALATATAGRPLGGSGAGSFLTASRMRQHGSPVRFAHDLPLELWVELGVPGLVLALGLYGGCAHALLRARGTRAAWLLAPGVAAFLLANLVDWSWHFAGLGAVFALGLGGLLGAARASATARYRPGSSAREAPSRRPRASSAATAR